MSGSGTPATEPGTARPLRLGLAGLGTVGAGVLGILTGNAGLLAGRAGRPIVVEAVAARDRQRDRGIALGDYRWADDPRDLAADPTIDLVVELIGGADGVALDLARTALGHGKPLVTANKAMLARHGAALGDLAAEHGVAIGFEAAVAGGIPIVKALREGLAGNRIERVSGILNGTCNYILSSMRETKRDFADVLAEAQALGYAEADPGLDIDGHDSAQKLAILASIAFGTPVDIDRVYVEGIGGIAALDLDYAEQLGYRIKLLATAAATARGIEQRVHPALVPLADPIARVDGVHNAVEVLGDSVGSVMLQGRGAGAGPTASAVVADILDIAGGRGLPAFRALAGCPPVVPIAEHRGGYYVRLTVADQPGVIADIAAELRNENVSVEAMIQRRHAPTEPAAVVLTTHPSQEAALGRALQRIGRLGTILEAPRMIRIES